MAHALLLLVCFGLVACGWAYPAQDLSSPNGRIVGGKETDVILYPHQISMRKKSIITPTNPYTHSCGGSIITADRILTAAHCITGTVASQIMVVAGTNKRNGTDGVMVPVTEIIMHEAYNASSFDNDVAVLVLGSQLPLNNFTIKAIELASEEPMVGAISTITGWGTTEFQGSSSYHLMAVDVPIVSNEVCDADYGGDMITDSMLCAGVRGEGGKDACQGDSGGPLVIRNQLHGVVSWGFRCAEPTHPGVYAKVYYLRDWIKSKVQLP